MSVRPAPLPISTAVAVLLAAAALTLVSAQDIARSAQQIAGLFPRSAPGPLELQARPVTPENPIPRRTRLVRPPYPAEAAAVAARASVTLRVTVDHLGTVGEVRAMGTPILGTMAPPGPVDERSLTAGLQALVRSAKDAVGQWIYEPPADAPITFDVVIGFTSEGDGDVIAQDTDIAHDWPPDRGVP